MPETTNIATATQEGTSTDDLQESTPTRISCEEAISSIETRLAWCALQLRNTANRGRAQLGEGYPEVLACLGAVNASLEVLARTKP
jgi:hypothetical protein